jgi:hypothetical protein
MLVHLAIWICVLLDRDWFMMGAGRCAGISLARDSVRPQQCLTVIGLLRKCAIQDVFWCLKTVNLDRFAKLVLGLRARLQSLTVYTKRRPDNFR